MTEKINKGLSLQQQSVRYKLAIAFSLMSVIPLLICGYFIRDITVNFTDYLRLISIVPVLLITIIITLLGLHVVRTILKPVLQMAQDAKQIAAGDLAHTIDISSNDEIGDLGKSLNLMTQKIKDNIMELRGYSEKTKEINIDINKKVMALSGLLQVGSFVSAGVELQTVMNLLADKISHLEDSNPTMVMILNDKLHAFEPISMLNINSNEHTSRPVLVGDGLIGRVALNSEIFILDANIKDETSDIREFKKNFEIENALIVPILLHKKCRGILITGNKKKPYFYHKDDVELINIFTKQAAMILENELLSKKVEELKVKDDLTGLHSNASINEKLEDEIKRSIVYQRPCSLVMLKVTDFELFCKQNGRMSGEAALKAMAKKIKSALSPVDKASRFSDNEFALLLPERNKREASKICEDIKDKISTLKLDLKTGPSKVKFDISTGISENPIDGASGAELIQKARQRLEHLKKV